MVLKKLLVDDSVVPIKDHMIDESVLTCSCTQLTSSRENLSLTSPESREVLSLAQLLSL